MRWSDLQLDPPIRVLRQFAAVGCLVLWAVAVWRFLLRGEVLLADILFVLGFALALTGYAGPRLIRPIYVVMTVVTFPIGWVMSWVLLGLVYYGLFTPFAVVFRLIGRDPLGRRGPSSADTYWKPKPAPRDPARYLRQY
jgi:hypothetical protein